MTLEFASSTEAASSLRARAERCRALSRVAYLPFAALMLLRLAEQFEGEAQRLAAAAAPERAPPSVGAPA